MAENHSRSKLKRKKISVEDQQAEISSRGTLSRSHRAVFPSRSVVPAAEWWNREQLPAVESLWALTLKSALPYLENQHCHLVPDLPHPSTSRPTALKLDDQRWCDLSEEVPPFPEPSPPSPRTSWSPDSVGLSSSQPVAAPPDRQLSSYSRQSHNAETTSLQGLSMRPQPSLHSRDGAASSSLSTAAAASDSRVTLQEKGTDEEEVVGDKEEEEVQRSVRGDGEAAGGGKLQSCPMCLLVFPAGFTQMDCDGHLAQCLSEVNVDVTW